MFCKYYDKRNQEPTTARGTSVLSYQPVVLNCFTFKISYKRVGVHFYVKNAVYMPNVTIYYAALLLL